MSGTTRRAILASAAAIAVPQDFHIAASWDDVFTRGPARHVRRRNRVTGGGDAGNTAGSAQGQQQANDNAQRAVLALARPMIQQSWQQNEAGDNAAIGQTYTAVLQNVGLNTKITIEVQGNLNCAAAETMRKTNFGIANFFSNIQLTDLSNYQRINTYGAHLHMLASLRRQAPFGAAYVTDSPVNMGSTWNVQNAPAAVAGVAEIPFRFFFELPLAYHEYDLRGAIYAQVTNAQWRLQMTVNPNFFVGSGAADDLFACYKSDQAAVTTCVLEDVVIKVYQHYLDQIPTGNGGMPVLPLLSLAWNYLILTTPQTGMVAGSDFPVQYSNFRTFLSTMAIYDNAGTFNTGSDVNYVGIQVANQTFLEKLDPFMATLKTRLILGDDPPPGMYIFDHRRWPIVTNQYGNTQFVLNASAVTAGASLQMFYEMLSVQAQAINAGSLSAT